MEKGLEIIYLYLMNTDMEIWRPVEAERVAGSIFKILSENENPEDEVWQFQTGDLVRCESRTLFDCTHKGCMVAVEKITRVHP